MTTTDTDLTFLQSLTEAEFTELVLIPLLEAMNYTDIRYTHGARELGKDLLFTRNDPIEGRLTMAAVVKIKKLSGSVSSKRGAREILFQIEQSLNEAPTDPLTGEPINVVRTYLVTPHQASIETIESIRGFLKGKNRQMGVFDGPRLIGAIKKHMPDLLQSIQTPERRFLQALFLRLTSSRTSEPLSPTKKISLLDIYTGGELVPTTREAASLATFANPQKSTSTVEAAAALAEHDELVIVADVGAGKTSLLQRLALNYLQSKIKQSEAHPLPLLVPLHRLSHSKLHNKQVADAVQQYLRAEGLNPPDISQTHESVLLLDGFDEVGDPAITGSEIFDDLKCQFKKVVITTRPSRIPDVSEDFAFFTLNPFSHSNIRAFLAKWFAQDHEKAAAIYDKIINDPVLRIFCRTPLILTLFAILADRFPIDRLPNRRTGIYSEISKLLLGHWDEIRGVRNIYPPDLKSYLLEGAALELQRRGERRVKAGNLLSNAKTALKLHAARGFGGSKSHLTRELIYRTSLLRPSGDDHLEFSHLSFQEFFAAKALIKTSDLALMKRSLYDDWWRGTWTFFFGLRRTLDDLKLPRQSRVRRAQALGAYLAEADYTCQEKREEILSIIGREILSQPRLDQESARFFTVYGTELIEAMITEMERGDFSGNLFNGILVAVVSEDDAALGLLHHSNPPWRDLSAEDIVLLLELLPLQLSLSPAVDVLADLCDVLPRKFDQSSEADRDNMWLELGRISENIRAARSHIQIPRDVYLRAQEVLFETGKSIRRDFRGEYDPDNLRHW